VGGDYDDYDQMVIFAEAQRRGISFEEASELLMSGNGDLLGGVCCFSNSSYIGE
jgi:hypothetical protein